MCDRKLNSTFSTQKSTIPEKIKTDKIVIPYDDPTLFQSVSLYSGGNRITSLSGEIVFSMGDEICNFGNYLEGKGNLSISSLVTGPYETKDGILDYRRLYFYFKNLQLKVKVRYNYDPNTICDGKPVPNPIEPKTLQDSSLNKLILKVIPEEKVSFSDFISANGENPSNINLQIQNLKPFFEDGSKGFTPFFDGFVVNINENTDIGKKIDQEFQKMLCGEEMNVKPTREVINMIKEMNLASVIFRKW